MTHATFTVVVYPESDGKPMGETDLHRDAMFRHIELLKRFYAGQKVYVSGDLLVYYQQGNNKKFIVPDAFIAKGKKQERRRVYKLWVEQVVPQLVIETTSKKTKKKDLNVKPKIYAQIGVKEYFMYDPTCDYLDPPLQGHRLVNGAYQPIPIESTGGLMSHELGLKLVILDDELEFIVPDSGKKLLTAEEARREESEARKREAEARKAAEAENALLREELNRLRQKSGN